MEEEDYPVAYVNLGPIHVSPVQALKVSSYLPSFASNSSVIEKLWWLDLWYGVSGQSLKFYESTKPLIPDSQHLELFQAFEKLS